LAVPLAARFGAEVLLPQVEAFGQVTARPVKVGSTKNPLQLIAPANRKNAETAASAGNFLL